MFTYVTYNIYIIYMFKIQKLQHVLSMILNMSKVGITIKSTNIPHTIYILASKDCSIQTYKHSNFKGICSKSKVRCSILVYDHYIL